MAVGYGSSELWPILCEYFEQYVRNWNLIILTTYYSYISQEYFILLIQTMFLKGSEPRLQVPVPVPFRETPETGMMTKLLRSSSWLRSSDSYLYRCFHFHGTPMTSMTSIVNWCSSGFTPTSFVFDVTSWRHIATCVSESESLNGKDCKERVPGQNDRNLTGIRKSGWNSAGTCILVQNRTARSLCHLKW